MVKGPGLKGLGETSNLKGVSGKENQGRNHCLTKLIQREGHQKGTADEV